MRFFRPPIRIPYAVGLLLLLLAAGGCGERQAPSASGLVPWTDRPPSPTAQLAQSATFATCDVAALRIPRDQQRWGGVWDGAVSGYVVLENSGRTTCLLPAPSRITASTGSGGPVAFGVGDRRVPAALLGPGDGVQLQVSSPYDCGKQLVRSAGFALTFPTGTRQIRGARMAVQCGGTLVDFSARNAGASAGGTARPLPTTRLRAAITRVPERVTPGAPASYTVTLTNPTSTAIALDPCPSYSEGIKGRPSSVRTYQLNCGVVRRIGAHAGVSFAMRLDLPAGLAPGDAVLDWRLQVAGPVGGGQFASADTTVE